MTKKFHPSPLKCGCVLVTVVLWTSCSSGEKQPTNNYGASLAYYLRRRRDVLQNLYGVGLYKAVCDHGQQVRQKLPDFLWFFNKDNENGKVLTDNWSTALHMYFPMRSEACVRAENGCTINAILVQIFKDMLMKEAFRDTGVVIEMNGDFQG
jgi:hypothetical protein